MQWNGQDIADMDTDHLKNTIAYLEKRAKIAYEHEGEVVRNTLDSYREQEFSEKEWYDFLPEEYYGLLTEFDSRPVDTGLNF